MEHCKTEKVIREHTFTEGYTKTSLYPTMEHGNINTGQLLQLTSLDEPEIVMFETTGRCH